MTSGISQAAWDTLGENAAAKAREILSAPSPPPAGFTPEQWAEARARFRRQIDRQAAGVREAHNAGLPAGRSPATGAKARAAAVRELFLP